MKSDLNYTPSAIFETFPFPQNVGEAQARQLEAIGEQYHAHRSDLMLAYCIGLTECYNLFHCEAFVPLPAEALQKPDKDFEKLYGKLPTRYRKSHAAQYNELASAIVRLRELHVEMDKAVLLAYGWQDLPLQHGFYDIDYLPENDRLRYSISPTARREVLARLLALNHQIYKNESQL